MADHIPFLRSGRRAVLLGGLTLAAGSAAGQTPPKMSVAAAPVSRMETGWWRARHEEKLARLRQGAVDLAWYGDSITQDWERDGPEEWARFAPVWERFYGDRRAVNLGFKGDNTGHLLWRIRNGEAEGIRPKAAVVLIGANNFGRVHWNAPQTVNGIGAVVQALRERLAGTKLLLLGVLPSDRSSYVSRTTNEVNRTLAAQYGGGVVPDVTYLDVGGLFLKAGLPDRSQFYDPLLTPPEPALHPTAQAQAKLAAAIEPTLAGLMGDRRHGAA